MSLIAQFLVIGFSRLLKGSGLGLFSLYGRTFGAFLHFVRFRASTINDNLQIALGKELSADELRELRRKIYTNLGTVFLEIVRNFSLSRNDIRNEMIVSAESRQKLDAILARGKGAILMSAHTSNWELCAMGVAAQDYKVYVVVRRVTGRLSQFLVSRLRQNSGVNVIYSGGVLERMREVLAEGAVVGIMLDQHKTGSKALRVNFFGSPADSIRGIAGLVRETGTPVVPVYACRMPDGRHEFRMLDEVEYIKSEAGAAEEERLNTQAYQDAIEEIVRANPSGWMWAHRRWKASHSY